MQEQHLKQVHLSRLSPVMWAYNEGYPRKTLGVPIEPAYGMGTYESVNPKGSPIWSETWQQRAAGALKRVHPFSMNGCGCGNEPETNGSEQMSRPWLGLGLLMALGVLFLYTKKD